MKKLILVTLCGLVMCGGPMYAQEKCFTGRLLQQQLLAHPEYAAARTHHRQHMAKQAEILVQNQNGSARYKTTAVVTIPVVFHVILTQAKINQLGNNVLQRAIDQVMVLNEDFNKGNGDSTKIPAAFKPLYGNTGIMFGLAHRKPDGSSTSGVDLKVTTVTNFSAMANNGSLPKFAATDGLDAWDPGKYLNIWIVDIAESGVLGYTIPPSFINSGYTPAETGVVIDYAAFGRRGGSIQYFSPGTNDLGRTATHEVGHFFELEHVFGEDPSCPGSGDIDDGIADTPPQGNFTYNSSYPNNTPPFPLTDACSAVSPGIMWMNFLDYTDDAFMYMFTHGQAAYTQVQVSQGGGSYSLTTHPEILEWPTAVSDLEQGTGISIYPNPTAGRFQVSFSDRKDLRQISVLNALGQKVYSITTGNSQISNYDIDLTGMSKGVYMVHCTFATGTITKKIVLQ